MAVRDIWITADDKMVSIESNEVIEGSVEADKQSEVIRAFQSGTSLKKLGIDPVVYELDSVMKIERGTSGWLKNSIFLEVRTGKGKATEQKSVDCEDDGTRETILKSLHTAMGEGWKREVITPTFFQAVWLPFLLIVIVSFVSAMLYLASTSEGGGGNGRVRTNIWGVIIYYLYFWAGPAVGVAVTVLILLPLIFWLVKAMMDPTKQDTIYLPK